MHGDLPAGYALLAICLRQRIHGNAFCRVRIHAHLAH